MLFIKNKEGEYNLLRVSFEMTLCFLFQRTISKLTYTKLDNTLSQLQGNFF